MRRLAAVALLLSAAVVLATLAVLAGPRPGIGASRQGQGQQATVVGTTHKGTGGPSFDRRLAFLVIGSDSGAPKFGRGGDVAGGRADSIHLVVVNPNTKRGVLIGIPRDSFVNIPGHGMSKINAAMSIGGPQLLVKTVEALSGIRIDYWVLTSFDGLTDLVNAVGGVTVKVDQNVSDHAAGANLHKGTQRLNGANALAYSRARKSLPGGDLTRSKHQGDVLLGGLDTFQSQLKRNPAALIVWLAATKDHVVTTDVPFDQLLRLALVAGQIRSSAFSNKVLPGVGGSAGGASIVRLAPGATKILQDARNGSF